MLQARNIISLLLLAPVILVSACNTAPKKADAASFNAETAALVNTLSEQNPQLANLFASAAGFAIFPVVGEGGLLIASGWGRGAVYEGGSLIGYASTSEHSIGAVAGGEKWTLVIFFQTEATLRQFEEGKFAWDAKANAVAGTAGGNVNTDYTDGVLLVRVDPAGLMGNASAGFSSYKYVSLADAFKDVDSSKDDAAKSGQ